MPRVLSALTCKDVMTDGTPQTPMGKFAASWDPIWLWASVEADQAAALAIVWYGPDSRPVGSVLAEVEPNPLIKRVGAFLVPAMYQKQGMNVFGDWLVMLGFDEHQLTAVKFQVYRPTMYSAAACFVADTPVGVRRFDIKG